MTVLEAIIIYLSAGAPFGALVFFAQRSAPTPVAIFHAFIATIAWPVFGAYRLYRGLYRLKGHQVRFGSDVAPLEVLQQISKEVPVEAAELFEIAGHPNPWLATNCYARARKKVIESHIDRLSTISVGELAASYISSTNEPVISLTTPLPNAPNLNSEAGIRNISLTSR